VIKVIVAVAVALSIGRALAGYRAPLAGRLEQLHLGWLLAAAGLGILHRVLSSLGWVLVVRSLGHPLALRTGTDLWFSTETLRWLPGSLWGMFARAARATERGVPAIAATLSLPLELLLSVVAWTLVALVSLGLSGTARTWISRLPTPWLVACALAFVLTIGAGLTLARWRPSSAISRKLRGLAESLRLLKEARPRAGGLIAALTFYVALSVLHGVAFLAVLRSVSDTVPGWLATIGINAAGWLVGFFAFFAPTGIGVREGTLTAMLAPLYPVDAAIVAVFLWRLVQISVELACLAAYLVPRAASARRRSPSGVVGGEVTPSIDS
jgi:hypothetical protein